MPKPITTTIKDPNRNLTFKLNEQVIATFSDGLEYVATIIKINSAQNVKLEYDDGIKKNQKIASVRKVENRADVEQVKWLAEAYYRSQEGEEGRGNQQAEVLEDISSVNDKMAVSSDANPKPTSSPPPSAKPTQGKSSTPGNF